MNYMKKEQKLKVYYDGLCILCSREIQHYKNQKGSEQIEFVDITNSGFNAQAEGVDPVQVHKIMHAKRPDGTLATRVGAFIEIWQRLPKYRVLARLAQAKAVRAALEAGYSVFAQVRPYLPKRKMAADCANSPYCELNSSP